MVKGGTSLILPIAKLARSMDETDKTTWLIGSPPCTFFSSWNQGINHRRMSAEKVEQLRKEAILHLHFVVSLYRIQLLSGRHFLHEHPAGATSWNDDWIKKLLNHPKVSAVVSDQCEYGRLTPDANGTPTPAKKPTRWMSSSPHMLKRLSKRCGVIMFINIWRVVVRSLLRTTHLSS